MIFNKHRYDRGHGSPYDRGSADRYYRRSFKPHFYTGGTRMSTQICLEDMTNIQIQEYRQGYEDQTDEKDWR
mgnify:FL=1|tara:strand:+ start:324 stop:539 length:216 start_codon:yes stop_codon:yes gene_type:complete